MQFPQVLTGIHLNIMYSKQDKMGKFYEYKSLQYMFFSFLNIFLNDKHFFSEF